MHFHHQQTRLHSEHPGPEPGEQEPLLMSDVQQGSLPPPPAPYHPDAKEMPLLRNFVYLAAPTPKRHTLDGIEHEDVWYGTVPNKQITLIVKRREKLRTPSFYMGGHGSNGRGGKGGSQGAAAKVVVEAWLIDKSLWKPRKVYADSRSFYDPSSVFKRGMQIDWARCCTERFKKTVLPFKVSTYYVLYLLCALLTISLSY